MALFGCIVYLEHNTFEIFFHHLKFYLPTYQANWLIGITCISNIPPKFQ